MPAVAGALALLACLRGGDAEAAEAVRRDFGDNESTAKVRHCLGEATGDREFLKEAKRLLNRRRRTCPEKYHESMLKNVRLNREIMEAWENQ